MTPRVAPSDIAVVADAAPAPPRFVPQSAADLRYFLYPVVLDGAAWHVLDRLVVAVAGGNLDLAIIGSSHVLTLHIGDAALTEVLACLPSVPAPVLPLAQRAARGCWQAQAACGPAVWTTHFAAQEYLSVAAFADAQAAIVAQRPALLRHFPQGPYPLPPLTAIGYAVAADEAQLTTWHTYPQERVIAVTQTIISLR
jgi:hypothetical protein